MAIVALTVLGATAAAAGAYLDWKLWHPMSGITITVGAGGILSLAALAWSIRDRATLTLRPVLRATAAGLAVAGASLLLGQNLGPAREAPILAQGTITIRLSQPPDAGQVTGAATCDLTASGDNFAVSGDPNTRLQVGDQDLRDQDFIGAYISRGDMWESGAESRRDGLGLSFVVGGGGPIPEEGGPEEVWMASDRQSQLDGGGDQEAGSIRFSKLVVLDRSGDEDSVPGPAIELAGTIEWSCDSGTDPR